MPDRTGIDAAPATPARQPVTRPRATLRRGWLALVATSVLTLVLAACGGGDGGVGSNGTGVTQGTVSGFGSVIVDGLRFDDSGAQVWVENGSAGDSAAAAEVKLGQRARVDYLGGVDDSAGIQGVAHRIEVDPTVIGVVTARPDAASFTVLGQTVRILAADGPAPVTVFEGYPNGFDDIEPGDVVEVHATRSGSGATALFQATRVERKAAAPAVPPYLRVSGVVGADLSPADRTFRIGGLTVKYGSAEVRPREAIGIGASVVVFAPAGGLSGTTLQASKIRVRDVAASSAVDDGFVGGLVSAHIPGRSMRVDGTSVDLSGSPEVSGTLAENVYVRVKGRFLASGVFRAAQVRVRNGEAELHGTVLNHTPASATQAGWFSVRGTWVGIQPGVTQLENCGADGELLADGAYAEVHGVVSRRGVSAIRIRCEAESGGDTTVVTRWGTVRGLSVAGNTFELQRIGRSPITVLYGRRTVFIHQGDVLDRDDGEAWLQAALAAGPGVSAEVEGTLSGGVLTARKIKLD